MNATAAEISERIGAAFRETGFPITDFIPIVFHDDGVIGRIVVLGKDCSWCEESPDLQMPLVLFRDNYDERGYIGFAIDLPLSFYLQHGLIKDGEVSIAVILDVIECEQPATKKYCAIARRILMENGFSKTMIRLA